MHITVEDQNGSKFGGSTVVGSVERCEGYAKPGDVFRVYVWGKDIGEPYPGWIAAWVSCDESGTVATFMCCRLAKARKQDTCPICKQEVGHAAGTA